MTNETTASQPTDFRKVLVAVRESLQFANDSPNSGIDDTIWMMHGPAPETVFDFIDAALDGEPLTPQKTADLFASQPKSIGDDAQFLELLKSVGRAIEPSQEEFFISKLVELIDSRAPAAQASATIQAAPEDDRALRAGRNMMDYAKRAGWPDDGEGAFEFLQRTFYEAGAATIQAPVMVAEPDNRSLKQAPDLGQSEASIRSWLQAHGYGNVTPLHVLNDLSSRIAKFTAVPIVAESVVNGQAQTITINGRQLQDALDAAWPDRADKDQGDTEITLFMRPAPGVDGEGGLLPAGLYLYWTEYPDEGCSWLNPDSELAPAAPMVADPAGVASFEVWAKASGYPTFKPNDGNYVGNTWHAYQGYLAATVKAVPSEELPVEPSEMQVLAAAIELSNRCADECCVDRRDYWKQYGDSVKVEARAFLVAAFAAPLADKTGGGE